MQTIGAVHHVALVVDDAEMLAKQYESGFGWTRMYDVVCEAPTASAVGRILGFQRPIDKVRLIMLHPPGVFTGNVELAEVASPDRGSMIGAGNFVLSFRVSDLDAAWASLLAQGYEPICAPEDITVGEWTTYCASFRHSDGVILETVQFRR